GGEGAVGAGELLEGEPWGLDHDVVEARFEAGRRFLGDVVDDLVEGVADGELGGHLRDRVAGGLRRERRRPRHARVHLDDDEPAVARIHRELDVAAAGVDTDLAQDGDREVAHLLVLAVGERHRGGDGHRVAGVHTDRVDVLYRAYYDDVFGVVEHDPDPVLIQ